MTESERNRLLALPVTLAAVAGLAWAGGQGGEVVGAVPLLAVCAALAVAVQWIAFVPAYLGRTERLAIDHTDGTLGNQRHR